MVECGSAFAPRVGDTRRTPPVRRRKAARHLPQHSSLRSASSASLLLLIAARWSQLEAAPCGCNSEAAPPMDRREHSSCPWGLQEAHPEHVGGRVNVVLQSSDAKRRWLEKVVREFERDHADWRGVGIHIELHLTSSALDTSLRPTIYSPSNLHWVRRNLNPETLQHALGAPAPVLCNVHWCDALKTVEAEQEGGTLLVSSTKTQCNSTLRVPLGLAMWSKRARALGWPEGDIALSQLVRLADSETGGWGGVPNAPPEWRDQVFKYGHSNPNISNSGQGMLLATLYSLVGKGESEGLSYQDVWANATRSGVAQIEAAVYHLDRNERDLMDLMVERGPSYLDAVSTYEPMVVEFNAECGELLRQQHGDDFAFIFPVDGTFWNYHPLCVLDYAEWNTDPLQLEAADAFVRYALSAEAMSFAPPLGYRPFYEPRGGESQWAEGSRVVEEFGAAPLDQDDVPALPWQDADIVLEAVQMWREVKKPAMVCLGIDTSMSMSLGNDMRDVKDGALSFISSMTDNDYMRLYTFSRKMSLQESGFLAGCRDNLERKVEGMHALGLGSAIYATLSSCIEFMLERQPMFGRDYNYVVVVMTDGNGDDYLTHKMQLDAMLAYMTGAGDGRTDEKPYPIQVYGILYDTGLDSGFSRVFFENISLLTSGKAYLADTSRLQDIFIEIATYF